MAYLGSTVPGFPNFFMISGTSHPVYPNETNSLSHPHYYRDCVPLNYRSEHRHRPHVRHLFRRVAGALPHAIPRAPARRSAQKRGAHGRRDGPVQRHAAGAFPRHRLDAVRVVVPRRWARAHRQPVPEPACAVLVVASEGSFNFVGRISRSMVLVLAWKSGAAIIMCGIRTRHCL